MKVIIENLIEKKVSEFQKRTGATKTFLANRMEISPQRMYQIMRSDNNNMMLDVLVRFALVLDCKIDDLIEYRDGHK